MEMIIGLLFCDCDKSSNGHGGNLTKFPDIPDAVVIFICTFFLFWQIFDGKDGRPKYPRRWVILPPFL